MNPSELNKISEAESSDANGGDSRSTKNSAVPPFSDFFGFVLNIAAESEVHIREAEKEAYSYFNLSEEAKKELLPSGSNSRVYSRISWAVHYLVHAGLLERPRRGHFVITKEGEKVLNYPPKKIDIKYLERFKGFSEFRERKGKVIIEFEESFAIENTTPEERIEEAYLEISADLKTRLLNQILDKDFVFFEKLVLRLLLAMGYGGFREEAAKHLGKPGDGGVDGVISQDKLGFERIYVQAKRITGKKVGEPEISRFIGSRRFKEFQKGIFFTTSSFTKPALNRAKDLPGLILIDGEKLLKLMIEHNVGVEIDNTIELKKIDEDFFDR